MDKKYYPVRRDTYNQNNNDNGYSIAKPVATSNRGRYKKGYQKSLTNAIRRTETYSKDKVVIVTESVNVLDFNGDNFSYEFGPNKQNSQNNYNRRKK